jgi:hypothetical protein
MFVCVYIYIYIYIYKYIYIWMRNRYVVAPARCRKGWEVRRDVDMSHKWTAPKRLHNTAARCPRKLVYVSIRQNMSAYVWVWGIRARRSGVRQHTSAYVSRRHHTSAYVCVWGIRAPPEESIRRNCWANTRLPTWEPTWDTSVSASLASSFAWLPSIALSRRSTQQSAKTKTTRAPKRQWQPM